LDVFITFHIHTEYSTEQSPWEAYRFLADQEIPRILWNPEVHYLIQKYAQPVPVLSQIDNTETEEI